MAQSFHIAKQEAQVKEVAKTVAADRDRLSGVKAELDACAADLDQREAAYQSAKAAFVAQASAVAASA